MFSKTSLSILILIATLLLIPATSFAGDEHDAPVVISLSGAGSGAFLGVTVEEEIDHAEGGARIIGVSEDSAAEQAGLQEGDVIVGLDGDTIRGPKALTHGLRDFEPGDAVSITVLRDGREQTVDAELGQRRGIRLHSGHVSMAPHMELLQCDEEDEDCNFSFNWNCEGDDCGEMSFDLNRLLSRRPLLGVQLVPVTDELREHMGSEEGVGVLVSRVVSGSPAEDAGIEVGDMIVAIDGKTVDDVSDIREALAHNVGRTFDLEVIRDRRSVRLDVTLPEPDDEAPSGPRAFHLSPQGLHHVHETVERAMEHAREALGRLHIQRDAASDAREAYEDALRESREHRSLRNSV
jgi:C-terminal processing protease CtpA/Prc